MTCDDCAAEFYKAKQTPLTEADTEAAHVAEDARIRAIEAEGNAFRNDPRHRDEPDDEDGETLFSCLADIEDETSSSDDDIFLHGNVSRAEFDRIKAALRTRGAS